MEAAGSAINVRGLWRLICSCKGDLNVCSLKYMRTLQVDRYNAIGGCRNTTSICKRDSCIKHSTTKRTCKERLIRNSESNKQNRTMWKQFQNVHFIVLYLLLTFTTLGYSATIGNHNDLDEIIDLDQEYLAYDSYHDNDDAVDTIQYYFRSDKGDNFKPLYRNTDIDLNSPLCYVDNTTGHLICEYGNSKGTHFYRDDDHTVAMAITNDNGTMKMRGIVNADNVVKEYEPMESPDLPTNRYHVIKKRWAATMIRKKYNYKKASSSKYKRVPEMPSPKNSYCLDVLCVVDYSIYKKFLAAEGSEKAAMEKVRYYYAHVINGINMRYSTIAQKDFSINVRLAGYYIAKKASDLPFMDAKKMAEDANYRVNTNYTLTELDAFLKKEQKKNSAAMPDYNHAMLFLEYTDTNIGGSVLDSKEPHIDESVYKYAYQNGDSKEDVKADDGGTSFVSGICTDSKATSLVVDHGAYTSSGVGCHEIGHNLGIYYHDGEGTAMKSSCSASKNYIMASASYLIDKSNLQYSFTFSQCSIDQIKENIDKLIAKNMNCLDCSDRQRKSRIDIQIDQEVNSYMDILPGVVDNVHEQCIHLYGTGSFMCPPRTPDEMCFRMYCYDPKRSSCAIISEQMAATGTPCGKYKVCKMGKCVSDSTGKDVPDDCPYPDLPSYGAHCQDATPFMCKNDKFKEKCCSSCNKEFTEEEACKDSHIQINGMSCAQLMASVYGRPGCAGDFNVQNMCCASCKRLLASGTSSNNNGMMVHLGTAPKSGGQQASQYRQQNYGSSGGARNSPSKNMPSRKGAPSRNTVKQIPQSVNKGASSSRSSSPPKDCVDSSITINQKTCSDIGKNFSYYCKSADVQKYCCLSCWKVLNK